MSRGEPRIFVRVACYRDAECNATARDALRKAALPGRVFFGVCWQYLPGVDRRALALDVPPRQLRSVRVSVGQSRGVCWARSHVERLHDGEEYTLQVDSHSRFAEGWDERLIEELAACASDKPLLSAAPPGYTPPDEREPNPRASVYCAKGFDARGNLRFRGRYLTEQPEFPRRAAFVAGGFMFARSEVLGEVPYDPHLYFEQEEASYALRLYTHGWDVFSPRCQVVFHRYQRPDRRDHWSDNRGWPALARRGLARFNHLTGYAPAEDDDALEQLDTYGLGAARTLDGYERFSGVDFRNKQLSERARYGLVGAAQ